VCIYHLILGEWYVCITMYDIAIAVHKMTSRGMLIIVAKILLVINTSIGNCSISRMVT